MSALSEKADVKDEEADLMFMPSIEEAILASGAHCAGQMHAPDPGDDTDEDDILRK